MEDKVIKPVTLEDGTKWYDTRELWMMLELKSHYTDFIKRFLDRNTGIKLPVDRFKPKYYKVKNTQGRTSQAYLVKRQDMVVLISKIGGIVKHTTEKLFEIKFKYKSKFTSGYIYVLKCNEFYKIGSSTTLEKRILSIQSSCPYEIQVVHTSERRSDFQELKKYLHLKFNYAHERGEWFKLSDTDLKELTELLGS